MITPTLERALLQGKIKWRNHAHFMGAVSKIRCPKDSTIIIIDFTVFPAADIKSRDDWQVYNNVDSRSVSVLDFFSNNNVRYNFIFRALWNIVYPGDPLLTAARGMANNTQAVKMDCWIPANEDIYITFSINPGVQDSAFIDDYNTLDERTNLPIPPISYGHSWPVSKSIFGDNVGLYAPVGAEEANITLPQPELREQPTPVFGNTLDPVIGAGATPQGGNSALPMVNISYVIVNSAYLKNLTT